ncbi:hypothetical protein CCACVL1_07077, partial [Corchorus capsularis]
MGTTGWNTLIIINEEDILCLAKANKNLRSVAKK